MPRRIPQLAIIAGLALWQPASAGPLPEALDAIQGQGFGSLTPAQLVDLAAHGAPAPVPDERSSDEVAHAAAGDPFFGQIVWWWAVERNLTTDAVMELLGDAWRERYGSPLPAEARLALQNALTGVPPLRTTSGAVYQPPSYVVTGPIYRPSSPFTVGWPGFEPQILSGISRISTGFPN